MKTSPAAEEVKAKRPAMLRATPAKSTHAVRIERDGGDYGAGLIRGVSLITRGEAIGHNRWVDSEMLDQVSEHANAARAGVKSRFTHPGLSSDGLGKFLGRSKNTRVVGDQVLGDLHLASTAHNTPEGDLADYVMDLAEEDPEALAVSIVYWADEGAELRHTSSHTDADGAFVSPDERNTKNIPHARVAQLDAADVVDEPGANPGGLFHRGQELPVEATTLLEYALLGGAAPPTAALGIDAERTRQFVRRTLAARPDLRAAVAALGDANETREAGGAAGTVPAHKERAMADEKKGSAPTPAAAPEQTVTPATLAELKAAFPDAQSDFLLQCLEQKLTLATAGQARLESVLRDNAAMAATITSLRAEVTSANKRAVEAQAQALQIGTDGRAVSAGGGKSYADNEQGWREEFNDKSPEGFSGPEAYAAYRAAVRAGRVHTKSD